MKNIHMIPTHLPSRLFLNKINNKLLLDGDTYSDLKKILPSSNYQHLYITSDEVIKEGDWYIDDANQIRKSITSDKQYWAVRQDYKKIILTTDKKLITDGVQTISDEFLKWFVKNPSCEEVKVEKEKVILGEVLGTTYIDYNYKIIIPQEEPKQETQGYICPQTKIQCDDECCVSAEDCHIKASIGILSEPKEETLEEAAERYTESTPDNDPIRIKSFIRGAKWQADRMYSEEDMRKAFSIGHKCARQGSYNDITEQQDFNKWKEEGYPINFEQYKKK
jgi:hypothetical protein